MSLPEKPLTRREVYLAKAAGQDVTLPEEDITREELYLRAIAEGGGGGGVTPEYVAEAIAEAKADIEEEIPTKTSDLTNDSGYAAIDDTTAAQNKTYSSAKVEEKVAGEEITTTATGTDLTLSTSSSNLNALTVYGKSEVVDGAIVSAGEGYAVVDLGTLTWGYDSSHQTPIFSTLLDTIGGVSESIDFVCPKYKPKAAFWWGANNDMCIGSGGSNLNISNFQYTNATDFKTAMSGVFLCYKLADPTQGNTIAVKTDNGTGIDGTMAVFETGTPLRGIPDSNVRDVMAWDGSTGEVTKNCNGLKITDVGWTKNTAIVQGVEYVYWSHYFSDIRKPTQASETPTWILTDKYEPMRSTNVVGNASTIAIQPNGNVLISTEDPTDVTVTPSGKFVYELATPTTEQLTTAENDSFAGLETYSPQTHAQNNAGATMTIEAYAGTANGKAVQELKQGVQSEISALKITQSDTLTLTVADWSSNQQTVSYAHDTAKRNVIDVDPASVEEWANCGVLATAETASGITFTCKTVPENALNFRVTSMGVN